MIGQPPRYTLATPVFRFRALAALSGRASLGGDRETLVACLQLGRLCAGILPPNELSRELMIERTENTKQWLSSLAVPSGIRSTAFGFSVLPSVCYSLGRLAAVDPAGLSTTATLTGLHATLAIRLR